MKTGRYPMMLRTIWALLVIFAVLQILFWAVGIAARTSFFIFHIVASWAFIVALALLATRRIGQLSTAVDQTTDTAHQLRGLIDQLQIRNAILQVVARTVDVPLAFQELAQRIAPLVACDRVGLALLNERGDEFQTYTARVVDEERRTRPRPDIMFKAERTAIGQVARTREPLLANDTAQGASEYLDLNVLHTAGFGSALIIPLISRGRAVGTLNLVSRKTDAFKEENVDVLLPIAEIFAVAYLAQQLQVSMAKHRTVEAMTELTLGVSSEINGALQIIIGHCDLLERGYPDPNLQRDLAVVVRQAQRIVSLLEKMRASSHERLRVSAETVSQGIPSSPEGFGA
jgi:transcriptional regulator with GAF, ATPase, and Fis domain